MKMHLRENIPPPTSFHLQTGYQILSLCARDEITFVSSVIAINFGLLPHSALSWILSKAENLAIPSLQDGATKWIYSAAGTTHPPTQPPHQLEIWRLSSFFQCCAVSPPQLSPPSTKYVRCPPHWYLTSVEVWLWLNLCLRVWHSQLSLSFNISGQTIREKFTFFSGFT